LKELAFNCRYLCADIRSAGTFARLRSFI
jgi:hypothetical protein